VARQDYLPFGEEVPGGVGPRAGVTGYDQSTGPRQKYAGMEQDEATGMSHTPWREFDSMSARWTAPDPYGGSIDPSSPQSFNRYAYVNNDPVNKVDPTGLMLSDIGIYQTDNAAVATRLNRATTERIRQYNDWVRTRAQERQTSTQRTNAAFVSSMGANGVASFSNNFFGGESSAMDQPEGGQSTYTQIASSGRNLPLTAPSQDNASELPRCTIQVRLARIDRSPLTTLFFHAYIVTADSDGSPKHYFRGGNNNGILDTTEGIYDKNSIDWDAGNPPNASITKIGTCNLYNKIFADYSFDVSFSRIPYSALSTNSNAYISGALNRAGLPTASFLKVFWEQYVITKPIGWGTHLPLQQRKKLPTLQ
jgi:RHS repeat-associated protein